MVNTAYTPLPTESNPPRVLPAKRPPRTIRRALLLLLIPLALVIVLGSWDVQQPESKTHELLKSTGLVKPDLGKGPISKHRELVSVILIVGSNDYGILDVMRSVLSMTVGPYELIGQY
jgi:hypothetical protein